MQRFLTLVAIAAFFTISSSNFNTAAAKGDPKIIRLFQAVSDSVANYLKTSTTVTSKVRIENSVPSGGKLKILFNQNLKDFPLRDKDVLAIYDIIDGMMPAPYAQYKGKTSIYSEDQSIEDLKSNFFTEHRNEAPVSEHYNRVTKLREDLVPLVMNISKPYSITAGLQGRHLAVWQSHGRYYDQNQKRWEWQRSRFFETVEDLFTQSYVLPYLVPMLENAGAVVLLPRERDFQKNEVIVDNDTPGESYSETGTWNRTAAPGFAMPSSGVLNRENPFTLGSARVCNTSEEETASVKWNPKIPESGTYGVYVSYQTLGNSARDARYTVCHKGGQTTFTVNQQMGGGTWIFLGYFDFEKGCYPGKGVILSNVSGEKGTVVSADAVRFGGGMGNIARKPDKSEFAVEPEVSGYPRTAEGARYWLQWAGYVDTVYSHSKGESDYKDDIWARCHWVNTLSGGSYVNPGAKGHHIPLDLCLGLHSDAGVCLTDSIIGTLAIYTPKSGDNKSHFRNGESRMVSRDLADIVQSSVVNDIRTLYEPLWSRRETWSRNYAESREPEVPSVLLEMLSHQNFADMRYGMDPSFRFTVSRAIYKGILKFLSYLNDYDYVVQPLPVTHISSSLTREEGKIFACLKWKPSVDSLEPGAVPQKYVLYTRINGGAFDGGHIVNDCSAKIQMEAGQLYSFRVTAVNEGGESFPSETISVGIAAKDAPTALIVNNFDRVSAPLSFASPDSTVGGFIDRIDAGVPYIRDVAYVGSQHEFRRDSKWMDDDNPGFGASDSNFETMTVAGNTFDYPYVHGKALMAAGYNFVSESREAFSNEPAPAATEYRILDIICGKQTSTQIGRTGSAPVRYTVFTRPIQENITAYSATGGNILVSGAYIASDIWEPEYEYCGNRILSPSDREAASKFATKVLKYKMLTNSASPAGVVKSAPNPLPFKSKEEYSFRTAPNEKCYAVESPDALTPIGKNTYVIMRYGDSNTAAGIAYQGTDYKVAAFGFPLETLESGEQLEKLMSQIAEFFNKK